MAFSRFCMADIKSWLAWRKYLNQRPRRAAMLILCRASTDKTCTKTHAGTLTSNREANVLPCIPDLRKSHTGHQTKTMQHNIISSQQGTTQGWLLSTQVPTVSKTENPFPKDVKSCSSTFSTLVTSVSRNLSACSNRDRTTSLAYPQFNDELGSTTLQDQARALSCRHNLADYAQVIGRVQQQCLLE